MRALRPDKMYPSVTDIAPDALRQMGVRGLLLDIDGTLMPTHADALLPQVVHWLDTLRAEGFALFILSNSRRDHRVRRLGEQLGLPYLFRAKKPSRRGFASAADTLGLPPGQLAMVGDQIFTDTLGANRSGLMSLLVESTDTDLWYQPLRRIFERPFMKEKSSHGA